MTDEIQKDRPVVMFNGGHRHAIKAVLGDQIVNRRTVRHLPAAGGGTTTIQVCAGDWFKESAK